MGNRTAPAVVATVGVVLLLAVAGAVWLLVQAPPGPAGLCVGNDAFREWKKVAATQPFSRERAKVARPVANALVNCDRPLIGMTRTEVRKRLGEPTPIPGADREFLYYDLGGDPRTLEIGHGLRLEFASGRVKNATIRE